MSKEERNRYLRYIAEGQLEIKKALNSSDSKAVNDAMRKYTGPGTGLSFRNGFLIPNYNVYSETDEELLIKKGDKVYV